MVDDICVNSRHGEAGRAFGLDYYLLPYLNNLWDRFRKSGKLGLIFRHSLHRDG